MKRNGQNIISDKDITMTDKEGRTLGYSLSSVIENIEKRVDKHDSQLKFLGSHGALGSGGGNGGSGGTSGRYSLRASLGGISLESGKQVTFGSPGVYNLEINIDRPGTAEYKVWYSFRSSSKTNPDILSTNKDIPDTLGFSTSKGISITYKLDFEKNTELTVGATDSLYGITTEITVSIVTNSWTITPSLSNNSGLSFNNSLIDNTKKDATLPTTNAMISSLSGSGLYMTIDYNVALKEIGQNDFNFSIDINGISYTTGTVDLINPGKTDDQRYIKRSGNSTSGKVRVDIIDLVKFSTNNVVDLTNANYSGTYRVTVVYNMAAPNAQPVPKTYEGYISIIPDGLFLQVAPASGTLYLSKPGDDSEPADTYSPGDIVINLKPYYGTSSSGSCNIISKIDDSRIQSISWDFSKAAYGLKISINEVNQWHTLDLRLTYGSESYPSGRNAYKRYYLYVKANSSVISWPDLRYGTNNKVEDYHSYFRSYTDIKQDGFKESLLGIIDSVKSELIQTSGSTVKTIKDIPYYYTNERVNTIINLGITYSEINSESNESNYILKFARKNNSNSEDTFFTIWQDKILYEQLDKSGITKSIYIPKTDLDSYSNSAKSGFHLITIVSRVVANSPNVSGSYLRENVVYLDGAIEAVVESLYTTKLVGDIIHFGSANYKINNIDIAYTSPSEDGNFVSLDNFVYQYYLQYSQIYKEADPEISRKNNILSSIGQNFTLQNDGNVLIATDSTSGINDIQVIGNLARNVKVPTIVFQMNNDVDYNNLCVGRTTSDDKTYPVTVLWYNPGIKSDTNDGLTEIKTPDQYNNAQFTIKMQGTSSMSYKCKNWTLALENNSGNGETYLFSPNFKKGDTNTFLPETAWTLKADVVDSSHSNNTSIGNFVNDNTTRFDVNPKGNSGRNTYLDGYIRNCLEGFPVILFLKIGDKSYYQGVYNFNLGRDSYYNLGYEDCSPMCSSDGTINITEATNNNFGYFRLQQGSQIKNGFISIEIADNNAMFDFSQWDPSILFEISGDSSDSDKHMFGHRVISNNLSASAQQIIQRMVYNVSKAGGYVWNYIGKDMSTDVSDKYGYNEQYSGTYANTKRQIFDTSTNTYIWKDVKNKPDNRVPNYLHHFVRKDANSNPTVDDSIVSTYGSYYNQNAGTAQDLQGTIATVDGDGNPVNPWIDFKALSEYYVVCMAFGMVDSVEKNMNLKCWNGTDLGGSYYGKFYPSFYDMDTCLGLNNAGEDNVNYFAFSDYWDINYVQQGNVRIPEEVVVYRDYSPKASADEQSGTYYDFPSSYLFALAKYASLIYKGDANRANIVADSPRNIWAKWRASDGPLRNAEYFMSNYFSNALSAVDPILISLDYRNKYLYLEKDSSGNYSYNDYNYVKLHGTRISKIKDWLNSRFHILDAYFNLDNEQNSFIYHYEKDASGNLLYNTISSDFIEPKIDDTLESNLKNNTDVDILQSIFSSTSDSQLSGALNFRIRAKDNSPLFVRTAGAKVNVRYLINSDALYNISMNLNGRQVFSVGGSSQWTYLDSIDTFQFSNLYINSRYLETLSGTSDSTNTAIDSKNIIMPSLRNLTLTGKNYTGSFAAENSEKYPNLVNVDVSRNNISLSISSSDSVSYINISKKGETAISSISSITKNPEVSITNCGNLKTLVIKSSDYTNSDQVSCTSLNSLTISSIPKKFFTDGLVIDHTAIRNITIGNTEATGDNEISKVVISNDQVVKNITISGVKEVYIENCVNLESISINDQDGIGDKVRAIYVRNVARNNNLKFNSTSSNVCDLSNLKNLKTLSIRDTVLTQILLYGTDDTEYFIPTYGFSGLWSLVYLGTTDGNGNYGKGKIWITPFNIDGSTNNSNLATFSGCHEFKAINDPSNKTTYSPLYLHKDVRTLNSLFANTKFFGHIPLEFAKKLLSDFSQKGQILSMNRAFQNQREMSYTVDDLRSDLAAYSRDHSISDTKLKTINLKGFTNLSDVRYAFVNTGIKAWSPWMFGFGSNVSTTISFDGFCLPVDNDIYTPLDILSGLSGKITVFPGIPLSYEGGSDSLRRYTIHFENTNGSGSMSGNVSLSSFFSSGGAPNKIESLSNIDFSEGPTYDMTGMFNGFTALRSIDQFMYSRSYSNISGYTERLLNPTGQGMPKLSSVTSSFNFNNKNNPVNWYTWCDWVNLVKNSGGNPFAVSKSYPYNTSGYYDGGWDAVNSNMYLYKYITNDNLTKYDDDKSKTGLLDILVGDNSTLTGIDSMFYNCYIILKNTDVALISISTKILNLGKNTKIVSMNSTFRNTRAYRMDNGFSTNLLTDSNERPINFTDNGTSENTAECNSILKYFPGVTQLRRCFAGVWMLHPVHINFFNKRRSSSQDVYIVKKNQKLPETKTNLWSEDIKYSTYTENEDGTKTESKWTTGTQDTGDGYKADGKNNSDMSGYFVKATLTTYSYNNTLSDIYGIFYNTRWYSVNDDHSKISSNTSARYFDNTGIENVPGNYLTLTDNDSGGYGNSGTVLSWKDYSDLQCYRIAQGIDSEAGDNSRKYFVPAVKILNENDCSEIIEGSDTLKVDKTVTYNNGANTQEFKDLELGNYTYTINQPGTSESVNNWELDSNTNKEPQYNKLIIAPDFFYGCSKDTLIKNALGNDGTDTKHTLQGMLPEKLLKNCNTVMLENFLLGANVIPRLKYLRMIKSDTGSTWIPDYFYVFVPNNFTNASSLNRAFNFHLIIPDISTNAKIIEYCLFDNESFNSYNLTSMQYALPLGGDRLYGSTTWTEGLRERSNYGDKNLNIYYRIMVNYNSATGNVSYGFNLSRYSNLNLDNFITGDMIAYCSGNLFNSGITLDQVAARRTSQNNPFFYGPYRSMGYVGGGAIQRVMNGELILPPSTAGTSYLNSKLFGRPSGDVFYVRKNQLSWGSDNNNYYYQLCSKNTTYIFELAD